MASDIKIEYGPDDKPIYHKTITDPAGCRWLMNEVCCNALNREMVGDFPYEEDCGEGNCKYFEPESEE